MPFGRPIASSPDCPLSRQQQAGVSASKHGARLHDVRAGRRHGGDTAPAAVRREGASGAVSCSEDGGRCRLQEHLFDGVKAALAPLNGDLKGEGHGVLGDHGRDVVPLGVDDAQDERERVLQRRLQGRLAVAPRAAVHGGCTVWAVRGGNLRQRDAPLLPVHALPVPPEPRLLAPLLIKRQVHLHDLPRVALQPRAARRDLLLDGLPHRLVAALHVRDVEEL
mmetsp:Transcript_39101/g.99051  ORF Transcript_39101/g.99051 Transcript_39101/m.99051 type:complete len:222 (+) Transcript_39101:1146-1811(+)